MRVRAVCAVGALTSASLVVASLAGAAPPFKRYALPAAASSQVASPGKLTVLLPAEWRVSTVWTWQKTKQGARGSSPYADDPVHAVQWWVDATLEKKGTTLADLRRRSTFHGSSHFSGPQSPVVRQVGDTYLTLPVGKVWRQTVLWVPLKADGGWAARWYTRSYLLDRGVAREARTGAEKELFSEFFVRCGPDACRTHNSQLAAIIGSIRFVP